MVLSQGDLDIAKRLETLPPERQLEIADAVNAAADDSGMGTLYDSILERVKPAFMSQSEFKEWAGKNGFSSSYDDLFGPGLSTSAYLPQLDKVVVADRYPRAEVQRLLKGRESNKAVLAHESLHAVQWRSSKFSPLSRLKAAQVEARLSVARSVLGSCSDDDAREWVAKYDQGHHFRQSAFEVAARCLTPEFEGVAMKVPDALIEEKAYGMTPQQVYALLMGITPVFGYFRGDYENAVDVDLAVHGWLGEHANHQLDFAEALNRLTHGRINEYGQKGTLYLMRRSEKLDKVYERAKKALKQYGLK